MNRRIRSAPLRFASSPFGARRLAAWLPALPTAGPANSSNVPSSRRARAHDFSSPLSRRPPTGRPKPAGNCSPRAAPRNYPQAPAAAGSGGTAQAEAEPGVGAAGRRKWAELRRAGKCQRLDGSAGPGKPGRPCGPATPAALGRRLRRPFRTPPSGQVGLRGGRGGGRPQELGEGGSGMGGRPSAGGDGAATPTDTDRPVRPAGGGEEGRGAAARRGGKPRLTARGEGGPADLGPWPGTVSARRAPEPPPAPTPGSGGARRGGEGRDATVASRSGARVARQQGRLRARGLGAPSARPLRCPRAAGSGLESGNGESVYVCVCVCVLE